MAVVPHQQGANLGPSVAVPQRPHEIKKRAADEENAPQSKSL